MWIQAALFVLPFIGLIFALIVLAITPRTSSFYRQWSKILMAGTLLVTAIVSFGLLVGSG